MSTRTPVAAQTELAGRVRDAYVPYMESIVEFFEKRTVEVVGRNPANAVDSRQPAERRDGAEAAGHVEAPRLSFRLARRGPQGRCLSPAQRVRLGSAIPGSTAGR